MSATIDWLLASGEPWTRYRTLLDLLDRPADDAQVEASRAQMLADPRVRGLVATMATWDDRALTRHNDASHPIHVLGVLADLGMRAIDPGLAPGLEAILTHRSPEGAFQSLLNIHERYGGGGEPTWTWLMCDAPVLLHGLLALGMGTDQRVQQAVEHLAGLVQDNGWRCVGGPEVGRFRGPGRKDDPCPVASLYAVRALSAVPDLLDSPAAHAGTEMILAHWAAFPGRKMYLFGVGTDYRRLKYPFVWYDILHVAEVLSRFSFVRDDARFQEMLDAIRAQADDQGRYTASSMYRAWKGWSFADKTQPSPWLTLLALRVLRRSGSE